MTNFFTLEDTNEIVLKAHSYISRIGIRIIDDKVCKGSSILEDGFYSFLDLLEVVEERKDLEITDNKLQQLILRLYSIVENQCIYYNSKYLDLDDPMFSGSVIVDSTNNLLFDNGIINNNGIVELGAPLIKSTTIEQDNNLFNIVNTASGLQTLSLYANPFNNINTPILALIADNGVTIGGTQSIISVGANSSEDGVINGIRLATINKQGELYKEQSLRIGLLGSELNRISITDDLNLFGAEYSSNYFTNGSLSDRWIPDWGAVKSIVPSLLSFNNGLTNNSGTVVLGGTALSHDTNIPLSNRYFTITDTHFGVEMSHINGFSVYYNDGSTFSSELGIYNTIVQLRYQTLPDGTYESFSTGNANGLLITDDTRSRGVIYNGDYESNFVARSLVTKQYVDGTIPTAVTANNGLTETGSNIQWGGPLLTNVDINQGAHMIEFHGTNTDQAIDVIFDDTAGGSSIILEVRDIGGTHGQAAIDLQSGVGSPDSHLTLQVRDNTDINKTTGIGLSNISSAGIYINDDITRFGVLYAEDYSAAGILNDRWIPDWGTVKTLIPTGLPPTGTAGGDLTGSYPNPTINQINSITKSYYDPTSSIQTQLNTKLPTASPIYTGVLTGPTQTIGDSTRNSTIFGIGTSIMKGINSADLTQVDSTYLEIVSRSKGIKVVNNGLSGRFLQQSTVGDTSIYSQIALGTIPAPTSVNDIYIIEAQVNDVYHDPATYLSTTYQSQLDAVVVAAHTAGWAYNRILIFNGAYYNPISSNPSSPNTETRHDAYAIAEQAIATARGCLWYDGYYTFKTAWLSNSALLDSNVLHPTIAGHALIATNLITFLAPYLTTLDLSLNIESVIGSQYIYGDVNAQQNINIGNNLNVANNIAGAVDITAVRAITGGTLATSTTLSVGTVATVTTRVATPSVVNLTSGTNSTVSLTDNGVLMLRNIADSIAAVTSQNANTSSTGAIHVFKYGSTIKTVITKDGYIGIGTTAPTAKLQLFGAATTNPWGSTLAQNLLISATTFTDSITTDSSTVTTANINYFGQPTINAANSTTGITYTTANNVVIAGAPLITGTNAIATNSYALNILAGGTRLGALTASSAVATDANKQLVSVTNTGSGSNVLATSPTLVTPILGTPTSVTLTNGTGLPATGLTGTLQAAQFPILTGDITTAGGVLATTLKNTGTSGTYGLVTTDAQGRVTSGTIITDIAHGGTGSSTQNFVDISTTQSSIGGVKTWTGQQVYNLAVTASGGAALGLVVSPTLTASANSDLGIPIDIAPTYIGFGAITATGSITGGSSYTNGTYNGVAVTDNIGNGFGATANVVVSGGAVTSFTIVNGGNQYRTTANQSVLTVASALIGGTGTGFTVPVTAINLTSTQTIGLRVKSGASYFTVAGTVAGGTGSMTLHASAIPTTNNYFLRSDGNSTFFNAPGSGSGSSLFFRLNGSTSCIINGSTGNFAIGVLGTAPTDNSVDKLQVSGGTVSSGLAGTTLGGYKLSGNTSGTIAILPQAVAGSYNFNLPITAGTSGYVLTSAGGGSAAMTWTALQSKPHTIFTPTTGGTVTLVNNQYNIVNPAGTLATLTVTLPSSPSNNDCVFIKFTQNVTTVTYSGGTISDGVISPISGGLVVLVYDSGAATWY